MSESMTTWVSGCGIGYRLASNYFAEIGELSLDLSEETVPEDTGDERGLVCSNMTPDAARWLRDRLSALLEQHDTATSVAS